MASKLKPVLILGIAGGVVAALRKRSGQASELAARAKEAAPQPIKQAVESAVEKVSDAVGDATGGGSEEDRDSKRRFAAPAEAGSQPPAEAGGAPSDDPQATVARTVPAEDLHTKPHDLPAGTVMPDTSDDDPSVREAEAAAEADAASIGRNADENQP
ncbi:MAG: hypothetical protein QOH76_195 [Thermoleophilaceae bacterium]|jgi:hypothetical protein|nr:hypothetical protein [Thermoleophilaceae bacterium]